MPGFFLDKSDPASWRALNGLALKVAEAAEHAGLPRSVMELLNVRTSQLNGCAYCLDLHVRLAREAGVSGQQLAVLPAWRDAAVFSEVECAALAIAEASTLQSGTAALHQELETARKALTDDQYSCLQWAAVAINAFNRVSILSGYPVRPRAEKAAREPEKSSRE
ncbi:carboxymuconolactone decarboxylase family protein [Arthrobacter sp. zg-Y40]|nr:carboxymuconolactone decarboxylase family protein [Arthrobacter sp. zg-Y40]MCC3280380.1 carboxymuconolactone decarboxylase family protein [Arthrobacter sp. zg-Y40]